MAYRITPHPWPTPAGLALAPRRTRIEDAFADMGDGVVLGEAGEVVAFHERHLPMYERVVALRASCWHGESSAQGTEPSGGTLLVCDDCGESWCEDPE